MVALRNHFCNTNSMSRTDFSSEDCSVARGLSEVGDIWSFLILREVMLGVMRFSDLQRNLNIAKNVLTDRLGKLVEHEILEKIDQGQHGPRFEYALTEKGRDLFPVMIAVRQWADRWVEPEKRKILILKDKNFEKPLARVKVHDAEGNEIDLDGITAELPG